MSSKQGTSRTTHVRSTAYRLPLTAYRLPLTAYRLPLTAYRLPLTAYRLPLTAYLAGWRLSPLGGGATFITSSTVVTPAATLSAPPRRSGFIPSR